MELAAALVVLIAAFLAGASFPVSVLCAVAVGMVVTQWQRRTLGGNDEHNVQRQSGGGGVGVTNGRGQHDNGEDDCSDPACVRCHAYRKVSAVAAERLKWYGGHVSARCREAVAVASGSAVAPSLVDLDGDAVLSTIARVGAPGLTRVQHPTVLFVPMLPAMPFGAGSPWQDVCDGNDDARSVTQQHSDLPRFSSSASYGSKSGGGASDGENTSGGHVSSDSSMCDFSVDMHRKIMGSTGGRLADDLRSELAALEAAEEASSWWKVNRTSEGEWRVLHLWNQGVRNDRACAMCPVATAIAEKSTPTAKMNISKTIYAEGTADARGHDDNQSSRHDHSLSRPSPANTVLTTCFGNAFFSVLRGPSVISPHCGPTNARRRVQVVLRADNVGKASLTVGGTSVLLNACDTSPCEHDVITFDDSFVHAARWDVDVPPDSSSPAAERALFIFDMFSPQLTVDEMAALSHAFAPVRKDG